MREPRMQRRGLFALIGAVLILSGVALAGTTVSPTEAQWADDVYGSSTFTASVHPDEDRNFARHAGPFGQLIRSGGNSTNFGPGPSTVSPGSSSPRVSDPDRNGDGQIDWVTASEGFLLNAEAQHRNCSRRENSRLETCAGTGHEAAGAKSFAVAQIQNFESRVLASLIPYIPIRLVALGQDTPTVATAACTPGRDGVATLTGGKLSLGSSLNPDEFDLPQPGKYVELNRDIGGYTYTGYLHHDYEVRDNYARSQLRLYLKAKGDVTGSTPWTIHVILAHAECGTRMNPTPAPDRPGSSDPRPATQLFATSNLRTRQVVETPSILEAMDVTGESQDDALLPSLDNAAADSGEDVTDSEPAIQTSGAAVPTTESPSQTDEPQSESIPASARPTDPTSVASTVPTTPSPSGAAATTTAEQSAVAEGPQQPESVRVGREFALVNRDGVELGTATVEDIVRTPGCGIEVTLSIATSDEAGPDRWASVGPENFAEVRPGGSIRKAGRTSSDCEQATISRTTALSPGRAYELVIAIQLSDSAQQAMLRPEGTAGWTVDLPPLPRVATTTSPAAAPATTNAVPETSAAAEVSPTAETAGA